MSQSETSTRSFTVNFASQVKDGLITSSDMISFLKSKMKIRNCLKLAEKEIDFKDNSTSIEISSKQGSIIKKNMKQYLKRYLRTKSLKNFIKVSGDSNNGFELLYINAVDEAEE
jgi:hypothetical protein